MRVGIYHNRWVIGIVFQFLPPPDQQRVPPIALNAIWNKREFDNDRQCTVDTHHVTSYAFHNDQKFHLPPSNRLHALKKDRSGQHSISINDQWRICFRWEDGDAFDVEITDYH